MANINQDSEFFSTNDDSFANVLVNVGWNRTADATSFWDQSSYRRTLTTAGGAKVSLAQEPFEGVGSLLPNSGHVSAPASADWAFGNAAFAIEVWAYFTSLPNGSAYVLCAWRDNSTDYTPVQLLTINATLYAYATSNGLTWNVLNGASFGNPPLNTWNHIALIRNTVGTNRFMTFMNGTLVSTVNSTASLWNNSKALRIGANGDNSNAFNGYIGGFRISNVARATGSFTAPKRPFENH